MAQDIVPKSPPMTKTDLRELKAITNNRFKLLNEQMSLAQQTAKMKARDDLMKDSEAAIQRIQNIYAKEVVPLLREAKTAIDRIKAEATVSGLKIADQTHYWDVVLNTRKLSVEPRSLEANLRKLQSELDRRVREAQLSLEEQRLTIIEQLSVGLLESEEAKAYVKQVPDLQDLLGLPSDLKKLLE